MMEYAATIVANLLTTESIFGALANAKIFEGFNRN
jgi:hypothetical protein